MALLLKGKEVADMLSAYVAKEVQELAKAGVTPGLAVVRVGDGLDDLAYERGVAKRCGLLGINAYLRQLPGDVSEGRLLSTLEGANNDESIHGILLLRPLPSHIDEDRACGALKPEKDVDGVTAASMAGVYSGSGLGYPPCTAMACVEVLKHYGVRTSGKRAAIVGRSLVIGRPLAMLLMELDATVTLCHSKTQGLADILRESDIVVAALGRPGVVGAGCFRKGQTIIDVGINVGADGKIRGDVDFDAASGLADAITPVPGGVGAVTTAVMARQVARAARKALAGC